ncbi:squalene/phytoene synthase family protein [Actibacterium pelagium]|uniref:Phytoene synthase n=1 Tax=Actibacterium pelagium TaxID=2029103 RepID=A0A917ADS4_9RHOB|nr:squalene/phytoene synthase family protein [Actibacterium pelagium]GGE41176.1 phytoene synthase [Actibacterium pelagium]
MTLQACADQVAKGDPDRFAATMAAPVSARAVLFPLYAMNLEVARAPWVTQEAMIAEMRLQWWRDALDEIAKGGHVRRHEVVTPLAEVLDAEAAAVLDGLVTARQWDIYRDPFKDEADFDRYIDATSGHLMWTAARLLGETNETAIRDIAYASGVASWLRAIPELEAQNRIPLLDGRPEAISELAQKALNRLSRAKTKNPATWPAWQARALLKRALSNPMLVAEGALQLSEFRRRGGLLLTSLTGKV